MSIQSRQPAGAPTGGQFATTGRGEASTVLVPLDGLSATTREAILGDLRSQRDQLVLRGESLREEAERVASEQDTVTRSLAELDERIADLADTDTPLADEPTVYRGPEHVDDVVVVAGYGTFHRSRPGVRPNQPYMCRIQVDHELNYDEARQLAQLVGYAYSRTGGERLGEPVQDAPNSIVLFMDTTKGRAYRHLEDRFEADLPELVAEGSPVRKTNRTGPVGTRAVPGLGVGDVHVYYDDVIDF